MQPFKHLENPFLVFWLDSDAPIFYPQTNPLTALLSPYPHYRLFSSSDKLDSIGQEIGDYLNQDGMLPHQPK
jgi:hypothetical protein